MHEVFHFSLTKIIALWHLIYLMLKHIVVMTASCWRYCECHIEPKSGYCHRALRKTTQLCSPKAALMFKHL